MNKDRFTVYSLRLTVRWIPACAGMTFRRGNDIFGRSHGIGSMGSIAPDGAKEVVCFPFRGFTPPAKYCRPFGTFSPVSTLGDHVGSPIASSRVGQGPTLS
jgi:hypothetical protein